MMLKLKYCKGCAAIFNKCHIFIGDNCEVTESPTLKRINRIDDLLCMNNVLRFYFYSTNGLLISQVTEQNDVGACFHDKKPELDRASLIERQSNQYYRYLDLDYVTSKFYYFDKVLKIPGLISLFYFKFYFKSPSRLFSKLI